MFALLPAALGLALQVQIQVGPRDYRNRPAAVKDSVNPDSGRIFPSRRRAVRLPVTEKVLATAYKNAGARDLLLFARRARMEQDSALKSYDATAYQRISAGLGFSKIGRDRLIFRTESAVHVQWHKDVGAWVELRGTRTVLPGIPKEGQDDAREDISDEEDMWPIPYYPGQEALWIGSGVAKGQVNEREIVHPIADGAEAYYTYEAGDSIVYRLPDARMVRLRELRIRPREPKWNVAVGSLWFDTQSGQLVRAAYRLAVPMDVWAIVEEEEPMSKREIPKWVMPLISPIRAQVTSIAVEYGLHQGRFWLPRVRAAEGNAQVSFMRVPFKMEQSFKYASVNAIDSLPAIQLASSSREMLDTLPDSLREIVRDSLRAARRARRDSIREGLLVSPKQVVACDTATTRLRQQYLEDSGMRVAYRIPCNLEALEHSPDLPKSIFDEGEELFSVKDRQALVAEALSLTAQPRFSLVPMVPLRREYGLAYTRYNRVEGLSTGGMLEQEFGGGYSARALGRIGVADWEPNVELSGARSNLAQSVRVTGYNRLVSANDWGNPLSFGSSIGAVLFGRDEGFYYRSSGVEATWAQERGNGSRFEWRFFGEQERTAKQSTSFSLAHASHGADFPANLVARREAYYGTSMRVTNTRGLNPDGFRVFTDLRAEAAAADSAYGRAALDFTVTQGFGRKIAGALTLSGGSSIGAVPAQRRWYLGGSQTIRGQAPDTAQSGNAFWMTRAELGMGLSSARPVIFSDLGWVGNRDSVRAVGRPLSGVGAGASFMDGLIRFDVARGLYPRKQWRVDMYVEAKF